MKNNKKISLSLFLVAMIFSFTVSPAFAASKKATTELGTMTGNLDAYTFAPRKHGTADTSLPNGKIAKQVIVKFTPKVYSTGASAGDGESAYKTNTNLAAVDWECHNDKISAQTLKYYSTHEVIHTKLTVIYLSLVY